jgi:hypothetical protein
VADEESAQAKPPYAPWSAFKQVWDVIVNRSPTRVDSTFLRERGKLSPNNAAKVAPAFRFLGIIDENGNPVVDVWNSISQKDPTAYESAVKRVVETAYARLVATYANAFQQTDVQLQDSIGDVYGVGSGNRAPTVTFFRQLQREAGMLEEDAVRPSSVQRQLVAAQKPSRSVAPDARSRATRSASSNGSGKLGDSSVAEPSPVRVIVNVNITLTDLDDEAMSKLEQVIRLAKGTE